MKKQFLLIAILSASLTSVFSQGSLRTSFNLSATNPSIPGTRITPWPAAVTSSYNAVAIEPISGDFIAVGLVNFGTLGTPNNDLIISRYTKTGALNTAFDTDGHLVIDLGGSKDEAFGVVVSGSKIYVVGQTYSVSPNSAFILSLNLDGTYNTSFNTTGSKIFSFRATNGGDYATCIAADASGRLVVGGVSKNTTDDIAVARFNTDGSFDSNFNTTAAGTGTAPVVGANIFDVRPLLQDGSAKEDHCLAIGIMSGGSGNIILGGDYNTTGSAFYDMALVNVKTDGTLNAGVGGWGRNTTTDGTPSGIKTFDIDGTNLNNDYISSLVIDASNNIFVGGYSYITSVFAAGLRNQMVILKTNSAGNLDVNFDTDGIRIFDLNTIYSATINDQTTAIVKSMDLTASTGTLVFGGTFNSDIVIGRLNGSTGAFDATFAAASVPQGLNKISAGTADGLNGLKISAGEIFAVGTSYGNLGLIPSLAVFDIANSQFGLPVNNLGFIAQKQSNSVQLQWKPQIDQSLTTFTVERSTDGRNYRPIGSVNANPSQTSNYSFLDNSPVAAVNYYRLAIKNTDDKVVFSNALAVRNSKASASLEVFPNPASQLVYVQLPASLRGKMNVRMNDVVGRTVATMSFDMIGEATTTSLNVSALNKGIYTISVVDELGAVVTSKHFVKN